MTAPPDQPAASSATEDRQETDSSDSLLLADSAGTPAGSIPVHLSYEIIRLFSEGLYQSPHKAIEELVSNSYDATATQAHVLIPDLFPQPPVVVQTELVATSYHVDDRTGRLDPLWVIDDGHGLTTEGFRLLWRVADSTKTDEPDALGRLPIGQFGIGKLAAYVLAWRLTHISQTDGQIYLASMNFRRISGTHQYDNARPLDLELRRLDRDDAMILLADVEARDPGAWSMMFGPDPSPSWTAAGLSDFKDLYDKLTIGRLAWVLRTGLPLNSNFSIWLDGRRLESSKESLKVAHEFEIGSMDDSSAKSLALHTPGGISIPGIPGAISGSARLFERKLTEGKSDQYGRSNGFFIRVRDRVINLEDELFGLPVLNHAAWSRFEMVIQADGLRSHLLSSREGVRESEAISVLREYMHGAFNQCRSAYERTTGTGQAEMDIKRLLSTAPSAFVSEPLIESVRSATERGEESFYFDPPSPDAAASEGWFEEFATKAQVSLFEKIEFLHSGERDRAVKYEPESRTLRINEDHPFVQKLVATGRDKAAATFFGSSELFVDALLQDYGLAPDLVINVMMDRDRVLRVIAGEMPNTAAEALRLLKSAEQHATALERAVGMAFSVLGFEYQKRGGNVGGTDGVLYARLGKGERGSLEDYKLVYDAKTTSSASVPADKIDFSSLEDFRIRERAHYGFFIATAYAGEDDPGGKINKKLAIVAQQQSPLSLVRVDQLRRLVEFHYKHGIPLTRVRSLFSSAHTVTEVDSWLDALQAELEGRKRVPLKLLLQTLEELKKDALAVPTVTAARQSDRRLATFPPEDLTAALSAVSTLLGPEWIQVGSTSSEVRLNARAEQITTEVERRLHDLLGVDTLGGIEEYSE